MHRRWGWGRWRVLQREHSKARWRRRERCVRSAGHRHHRRRDGHHRTWRRRGNGLDNDGHQWHGRHCYHLRVPSYRLWRRWRRGGRHGGRSREQLLLRRRYWRRLLVVHWRRRGWRWVRRRGWQYGLRRRQWGAERLQWTRRQRFYGRLWRGDQRRRRRRRVQRHRGDVLPCSCWWRRWRRRHFGIPGDIRWSRVGGLRRSGVRVCFDLQRGSQLRWRWWGRRWRLHRGYKSSRQGRRFRPVHRDLVGVTWQGRRVSCRIEDRGAG